jgi:hypothetical protein
MHNLLPGKMREKKMPTFQVTITRKITTSTIIDMVADDEDEAKEEALTKIWNTRDNEIDWEPDKNVDWITSEPFISDIVELD